MPKNTQTRAVVVISLLTVITCSIIFLSAPSPAHDKNESSKTYVNTIQPEVIEFQPTYTSYGRITAREQLTLRAQTTGEITALHPNFELGAFIKKGEMLSKIDDRTLKNQLVSAQNRYTIAKAQLALEKAQQTVASKELALASQGYNNTVTDTAIRLREPQMIAAQSEVTISKKETELASLALEKATFISPRNYQIIERSVHLGDFVSQGQALATLADLSTLRVETLVPKSVAKQLSPDQEVLVRTADNQSTLGRVNHIVSKLDSKTQLQKIIVVLADSNFILDEFVEIDFSLKRHKNIIKLPPTAISNETVWVVDDKNILQNRPFEVIWNDKNWVYAINSLAKGEQVAEHKLSGARTGIKVTVIAKPITLVR